MFKDKVYQYKVDINLNIYKDKYIKQLQSNTFK